MTSTDVFPERLKISRKLRRLDQPRLAEISGIAQSSISHFERGSRKPSFDNLRRIASALTVTSDFLLGISDEHCTNTRNLDGLTQEDKYLVDSFISMIIRIRKDRYND